MDLVRGTLHEQVREILRLKIKEGEYKDKIPSETELMKVFSVSRATIREAILGLVKEGVLIRKQGIGTFISESPIHEWLSHLYGFTETMENMGFTPKARFIKQMKTQDSRMQELLDSKEIYVIERLRLVEDTPIAIEMSYFPSHIGEKLIEKKAQAFYLFIENELGTMLERAEQSISSILAGNHEAELLEVQPGHPLLQIQRINYSSQNKPVEYLSSVYRGDLYSFKVDLKRNRL